MRIIFFIGLAFLGVTVVWDELEGLRPAPVGRAPGFLPFGKSAPSLTSVVPLPRFRCLVFRRAERKQRAPGHAPYARTLPRCRYSWRGILRRRAYRSGDHRGS